MLNYCCKYEYIPTIKLEFLRIMEEFETESNEVYSLILEVFSIGSSIIYYSKNLSDDTIERLRELKGKTKLTDIVVDAILERKIPDEISQDSAIPFTAFILAKRIIHTLND